MTRLVRTPPNPHSAEPKRKRAVNTAKAEKKKPPQSGGMTEAADYAHGSLRGAELGGVARTRILNASSEQATFPPRFLSAG